MEKKSENIHPDQWLKDLPVQAEAEGFKPEEMATCPKCGRKSPPTRAACFYCGAQLTLSEAQSRFLKPNLRKLEPWEKGFNVIYVPGEQAPETSGSELARLLSIEKEETRKLLETKKTLPVARVESAPEAEILITRLKDLGLESRVVSDESLKLETVPRRLRGVEFLNDKLILILFNVDEVVEVPVEDLALIVTGAFFERKIEATESLKRKKENKVLDSSEVSSDELLIDIYPKNDSVGYRIELAGFDFSCLGDEKGWLAKDNMQKLLQKLRLIANQTKFDDDYLRIRGELGRVWEVDQRSDTGAVDRKALGVYQRKNITTINNLSQFTRYSRLMSILGFGF